MSTTIVLREVRLRSRHAPDYRDPMELLLRVEDYAKFARTIKVLFDAASVERIKAARGKAQRIVD